MKRPNKAPTRLMTPLGSADRIQKDVTRRHRWTMGQAGFVVGAKSYPLGVSSEEINPCLPVPLLHPLSWGDPLGNPSHRLQAWPGLTEPGQAWAGLVWPGLARKA